MHDIVKALAKLMTQSGAWSCSVDLAAWSSIIV